MKDTTAQIVPESPVAIILLVAVALVLSTAVGGLLGAGVALAYNMLFVASFKVLPAAYTGSIVFVAAGVAAVGSSIPS
jgi:hypothetical protein